MMMTTTTAAVAAKMTMAMIFSPHVALNRERKGGIVDFVFVGSKTQQRTISGHKVAEVKRLETQPKSRKEKGSSA
jgi:hypothetical protein